jgi:hypothetical protein
MGGKGVGQIYDAQNTKVYPLNNAPGSFICAVKVYNASEQRTYTRMVLLTLSIDITGTKLCAVAAGAGYVNDGDFTGSAFQLNSAWARKTDGSVATSSESDGYGLVGVKISISKTFEVTTISEDSATILPLQIAARRFMERIYTPSSEFIARESDLPDLVKTIMKYYSDYLKTRPSDTYDVENQWGLKYTGETKDLEKLKSTTPWDTSYKYYRWNFADPTQCTRADVLNAETPDFEFCFHQLDDPVIYTYAKSSGRTKEGFQISQINTGKTRIDATNQKYKNGVLMVQFDGPVLFDGYRWDKTDTNLSLPPNAGWVLQGSNDASVWSDNFDTSAYRDNLQLDSAKWTTLHVVAKKGTGTEVPSAIADVISKNNVPATKEYDASEKYISNVSRQSMKMHLKYATLAMLTQYILQIRNVYVNLPSTLQAKIIDCYSDIERDLSDSKNKDLNERRTDELVKKYIYDPTGSGTISTLEDVELQVSPDNVMSAAIEAQNDTSKVVSMRVASELDLVPGMFVRVSRKANTDKSVVDFEANISSYAKNSAGNGGFFAGSLSLNRMRNFKSTAKGADFSGNQGYIIQAFFYDTKTKAPTARSTSEVSISPTAGGSVTFTVQSGLTYPANSTVNVKVYNLKNEFDYFNGTVSYSNSSLTVSGITNIKTNNEGGNFPTTATTWVIKPVDEQETSQQLTPVAESTIDFYVDSGLSYEADTSVRVTNTDTTRTFEASVDTYNSKTGFVKLKKIRNIVGDFRDMSVYKMVPLQNACIVRLRDQMYTDISAKMNSMYKFISGCKTMGDTVVTKTDTSTTVVLNETDSITGTKTEVKTYTLNPTDDKKKLNKEKTNLTRVNEIYSKYTDAFNYLIKTNIMQKNVTVDSTSAVSAEGLGLFEEPNSLRAVSAFPDIVLRQLQRMINAKMKYFYNIYSFEESTATVTRGDSSSYTQTILKPVTYTKFYEPDLRDLFTLDPTTGKSQLTRDYEQLWNTKFSTKYMSDDDTEMDGKQILVAMNAKYDDLIERLKANKLIAEERMKTIQRMEVFEELYSMLSGVLTTMIIQLPAKSVRDNERLFVAPSSNSVKELTALRNKYIDYMYTNKLMQNYIQVPNDLYSCAKKAIDDLTADVKELYETDDPTPEGTTERLSEWRRTLTVAGTKAEKKHFVELEDAYGIIDANRPSVVYDDINSGKFIKDVSGAFAFLTNPANDVFKKPESGDSIGGATKTNLDNYNNVVAKIKYIQDKFIAMYNAKEVLDPAKEDNKELGLITRTRAAIQIDKLKIRVRKLVSYYKKLYEAYVDGSWNASNVTTWEKLYNQPIMKLPDGNQLSYIVEVSSAPAGYTLMFGSQLQSLTDSNIDTTNKKYITVSGTDDVISAFNAISSAILNVISSTNPKTIYDKYKITKPTTTLAATYEIDLNNIDANADIANANKIQQSLLDMEASYKNYMKDLVDYVKNVSGQIFTKFKLMRTDYIDGPGGNKFTAISGSNNYADKTSHFGIIGGPTDIPSCSTIDQDIDYLNELTFDISNDTKRAKSYASLENLLSSRNVCGTPGTAVPAGGFTLFTYTNPLIVSTYIEKYNKLLKQIFAYEFEYGRTKLILGRAYKEYKKLYDILTTDVDSCTLYASKPIEKTMANVTSDTFPNTYNAIGTFAGWINDLINDPTYGLKTIINTFVGTGSGIGKFVNDNQNLSWYNTKYVPSLSFIIGKSLPSYTDVPNVPTASTLFGRFAKDSIFANTTIDTLSNNDTNYLRQVDKRLIDIFRPWCHRMMAIKVDIDNVKTKQTINFAQTGTTVNGWNDITTNGYKTLDYLLVGGGGGGAGHRGKADNIGGGGGASGSYKATLRGDEFGVSSLVTANTTSLTIESGKNYKVYVGAGGGGSAIKNTDPDHGNGVNTGPGGSGYPTTLNKEDVKIDEAGGGQGGGSIYKIENGILVHDSDKVWQKGIGGTFNFAINSNDGGDGVTEKANSGIGQNRWGGVSADSIHAGSGGTDSAGGGGGAGIGRGKGGNGATTHENGKGGTAGEDFSGAGGGGGADADGQNPSPGSRGGSGYAIIILNHGITKPDPNPLKTFVERYGGISGSASNSPFQNQYPYNPQQVQRKILTQKLNSVQFSTTPSTPKPPTILGLLSWFWWR